jgi:hypothetical protein
MDDEVETSVAESYNRLRGRLCGLIESFGLDERQERGCINTLKSLTYDSQAELLEILEEKE